MAAGHGVPSEAAGRVGEAGGKLEILLRDTQVTYGWASQGLRQAYFDAIPRRMRVDGERDLEGH